VEKRRLISHADAEQMLRRAGYSQGLIDDVLREVPDPIDAERDGEVLFKHGISAGSLMQVMGSSP
jgi:hypothetical protein